jgi:hypothetical protein
MIFLPAIRAVFHIRDVNPEIVVAIFTVLSPYFFSWHSFITFYFGQDTIFDRVAGNGSPDLRGFGAGVAKLRSAEKSRKCADVSRSRPHLRMQSGDPMWRRMAPHRFSAIRRQGF